MHNVRQAFRICEKLAKTHYENFTVGSLLLPPSKRQHIYNLYAYCRFVDDLGDESNHSLRLLNEWEQDLDRCYNGMPAHPVLIAIQQTIKNFDIPTEPFKRLIAANRMDQKKRRYKTFEDLLYYCDHSANPCGRLFLYVFGVRDPDLHKLSDYTCTALQLANFWQDIPIDYKKGRIYIPLEDMDRFGYSLNELSRSTLNEGFKHLMKFEIERTRNLFRKGLELVKKVKGVFKFDLRLFTRGGLSILDEIEKREYDVFSSRPMVSNRQKIWLMIKTLLG